MNTYFGTKGVGNENLGYNTIILGLSSWENINIRIDICLRQMMHGSIHISFYANAFNLGQPKDL